MRGAKPVFSGNWALGASFSTGEVDLKEYWGVRALHACVFSLLLGVLEPPRTSDCTIVVVYGGLGSPECEAPSPFLVVTELRELVFLTGEADLKAH